MLGGTMIFSVGDTVRPIDDLQRRGTVLKISTQPRRDWEGIEYHGWPHMVFVQWAKTRLWEPPELLTQVHDD